MKDIYKSLHKSRNKKKTISKIKKVVKYKDEDILCISNSILKDYPIVKDTFNTSFIKNNCIVLDRNEVEFDIDFRQFIICAFIVYNDKILVTIPKKDHLIFKNNYKMIGGHVSIEGFDLDESIFINNLIRELNEELIINEDINPKFFTTIYDEKTISISDYHIGLIYLIELNEMPKLTESEAEIYDLVAIDLYDAKNVYNMDRWTKITYKKYMNTIYVETTIRSTLYED